MNMSDAAIDFKELRFETRRRQILVGASQVFAEKSYHKATTKEIARAAGVSEGTIYNYFNNKRELLLAMMAMFATESLKTNILDQPPEDPREFLRLILRDRFQLLQEHGQLLVPLMAEIFSDTDLREAVYHEIFKPILASLEHYMQQQIDAKRLRPINPLIIARTFMGSGHDKLWL